MINGLSVFALVCISFNVFSFQGSNGGRTFYVAATGDDANNGTSASAPWKSISKVNSATLQPGDHVLFKRGNTFQGTIQISQSGAAGAAITFGAYGTGSKPLISGFASLTSWSNVKKGVYEAPLDKSGAALNLVVVNNKMQGMGRYPNLSAANKGYLTYESHTGNNSITDNSLRDSPNWTGADAVVRKTNFLLDIGTITSQSQGTITYNTNEPHKFNDHYGYFIQNHPGTLDQPGEWYYNKSTKSLQVFLGKSGSGDVKASVTDNLVVLKNNSFISFDGLAFEGANAAAFLINTSSDITIANSSITYSGGYAVCIRGGARVKVIGNLISETEDTAIDGFNCNDAVVKGNNITNSGLIPGMGKRYAGIFFTGENALIEANSIENSGYNGIQLYGNNAIAKNNFINNFTMVIDDGAGIFMSNKTYRGRQITGNIILNGVGAPEGTSQPASLSGLPSEGIYVDDNTSDVLITGNTVSHVSGNGIKVHNAHNITIENNTLFDNKNQLLLDYDSNPNGDIIRNITVNNNTLFMKKGSQSTLQMQSIKDDINQFGNFSKNTFVQPSGGQSSIKTRTLNRFVQSYDLSKFKSFSGNNAQSKTVMLSLPTSTSLFSGFANANIFPNGTFDSSIAGTTSYSKTKDFSTSWSNNNQLDGGALQGTVNNTAGTNDGGSNNITTAVGAVKANQSYALHFSIIGSSNIPNGGLSVYLRKVGAPYTALTDQQVINVTSTRTDQEIVFTPNQDEDAVFVTFLVNIPGRNSFWLDNVSMQRVNLDTNNSDPYILFVYNKTDNAKVVPLNGSYKNTDGTVVSNEISLEPHTSAVLIKQTVPIQISSKDN